MKAPDKIYVSSLIYGTWQFTEHDPDDETEVEYICKDTLLEFLKKKINEIEIAMETGADDPVLWGQKNAFKQMINKIDSM